MKDTPLDQALVEFGKLPIKRQSEILKELIVMTPEEEQDEKYIDQVGELVLTDADGVICHVASDIAQGSHHDNENSYFSFMIRNPKTNAQYQVNLSIVELMEEE